MSHLRIGQFFGEVSGRLVTADAVLTRVEHDQPRRLPRHSHQAAYMSLLLKGQYRESSGTRSIDCAPLTLVFHPPETSHDDEIGPEGGTFFIVEIGAVWFERMRELSRLEMPAMAAQHGAARWLALQLCRAHAEGTLSALEAESTIGEMLADALRVRLPDAGSAPWLQRVVEQLHAGFDRALTVDQLAREAGVHPVHLSRVFRKRFGMPLGEYVNRLRIDFATRELARPESRLADIALAAGFADQSHFSRVARRLSGATPGQLRRVVG